MAIGLSLGLGLDSSSAGAAAPAGPVTILDAVTATILAGGTFTRSGSVGGRYNSSGVWGDEAANTPRLDYDPITLAVKGWLIEESRTNLLSNTQDMNAAGWTRTGLPVTADQGLDIRGNNSLDKGAETAAASAHALGQSISVTSGTPYTHSFFVKGAGRTWVASNCTVNFTTNPRVGFDLTGLTATPLVGNPASTGRIEQHAQSLRRCIATHNPNASGTSAFRMELGQDGTSSNFASYTGDGTSGVICGDFQVEAGAFATSLIPGGSTRNAELWQFLTSAIPGWSATEGRLVITARVPVSGSRMLLSLSDNTYSNLLQLFVNATNTVADFTAGGVGQAYLTGPAPTAYTEFKVAVSWKANEFAMSVNGAANATDTSGTVPTYDRLTIGARHDSAIHMNGHIKKVVYYPTADAASLPALSA